ncbi:hypothetical protein L2764_06700 [Shewanella surugensis]|uniref:Uncharacterized protein n=2 Tax=Shewanella surugensis TaxID=212020 RepID=A0ABT0L8Z3_9GAMM|nr:hypothetical protein [Shewanella surugensis]
MATEHGLKAKVSNKFENVMIEHIDQVDESDMNLLTRLADRHNAISKPANGFWLFLKEGEGKSASGKVLSVLHINKEWVSSWQCRFNSRNDVNSVIATYHDVTTGMAKEVTVGSGEPAFRIAYKYPNYEEALASATSRAKTVVSGSDTFDITMAANSALMNTVAEGHVDLDGFGDLEDGKWRVKSLEWSLSSTGLQLRIAGDHGVVDG